MNALFGAVGHWGVPDIGWNGNVRTGQWTFVAYTYDAATLTQNVYSDGQLANTGTNIMLNVASVDTSPQMNPLPFRVAAQTDTTGTPTVDLRGTMTIARIRVYDEVLTADEISAKYQAEYGAFNSQAPVCLARIACAVTFTNDSTNYLISLTGSNACTVLDGRQSFDPEGDPIGIRWFADQNPTPIGSGPLSTNCFGLGCHTVTLAATDPFGIQCATNIDVCVLTACDALVKLIVLIEDSALSRKDKRPLVTTLKNSCVNFEAGEFVPAMNQLQAFQNKVSAQLGKTHPAEAEAIIAFAQKILDGIDCAALLAAGEQ